MLWAELRADEITALPKDDAIVVIPVASMENHGPHLPTGVDIYLSSEIARRAAERTTGVPVIVTPAVWSGLAEMHMSLGGTVTLDLDTMHAVLRCLCGSAVRQGFRRVLLLNGHGGNIGALQAITNELGARFDIAIATTSYWMLAADAFADILEDQSSLEHACEGETSMMMRLRPELPLASAFRNAIGPTTPTSAEIAGPAVHRWRAFHARSSHGAIGNPTRASAEKGERLLEAAANAVAGLLGNRTFWEMSF